MKILFYSSYFYPYISGLTIYPKRILEHFSPMHRVTILTFPHGKNLKTEETFNDLNIIRMPYLFKISKGYISPQSLVYFLAEIKKNDLLIVNIPNFEALALVIFAKLFGKKVIAIFHCQVNLGKDFKSKIINFFLNASVYLQLYFSDTIIAYPDYIDYLLVGRLFNKKIRKTLPPVTPLKVEKKTLVKFKSDKKNGSWIGFVGRIAAEKGIKYLIDAVNKLNKQFNITILFAGPYGEDVSGENKYFLNIERKLKSFNIKHQFLGVLSEDELGAFYKAIDLLVLPSVNSTEAFGMVQAEAMLAGTPVVASSLPGARIPIELTKMGIVVEPKNTDALTSAILEVLKNRKKYTSPNHVKKTREIFDIKKTYEFYENIL